MFPQCYLSYSDHFKRAVPVMPGSFPSSFPGPSPMTMPGPSPMAMPGPELFPGTMQGGGMQEGENIMGGEAMPQAGTTQQPTGMPGMQGGGVMPTPTTPSPFEVAPGSPTILDTDYTQGFLRTQIGRRMRVTFLLGTSTLQDREGILEKVGISYIILREVDTNVLVLCDIYSIKFVNIFSR